MHIWLGNEDSFNQLKLAQEGLRDLQARVGGGYFSDLEMPSLYSRHGDIGVIEIFGSLIEGKAGFFRLFGLTGYDDITEAIVEAMADKRAKAILYNIKSSGGSVSGVQDTADTIKNASTVKPSSVYTDNMCSAAYWLGSSAGHITQSALGISGSIGSVMVHQERSTQLKNAGITTTVVRSGPHKMVANSVEPLSEEGRAYLENLVTYSSDVFDKVVAENRGVSVETVKSRMGGGRVFMGQQAVDVGLVDRLGDWQDALVHAQSKVK